MARSRNPEPCGSYSGDYYLPLVWSTAVYQPQAQFCVNTLFLLSLSPPPPTSLSSSLSLSLSLLLFSSLLSLPLHWLLCAHVASKHTLHNVVASTTLSCGWNNCLLPLQQNYMSQAFHNTHQHFRSYAIPAPYIQGEQNYTIFTTKQYPVLQLYTK